MQGMSLKIVSNVLYIIFYTFIILFNCLIPSGSPQPCSSPTTATAMPSQQSRTPLSCSACLYLTLTVRLLSESVC